MNGVPSNPTDMYSFLIDIKDQKRGCLLVTKKHVEANGMKWSFVVNACGVLGLQLSKHGRYGFMASRYN